MKKIIKRHLSILLILALLSCSTDSSNESVNLNLDFTGGNPINNNNAHSNNNTTPSTNIYFGFLDGPGSSTTYKDMPIESSATNLLVGRWKVTKVGVDESNNNNIVYYNYQDYNHKDCGLSFLQFNNNGTAFENCFYKSNGICTLYVESDSWELIGDNLKTTLYNNIYVIQVSDTSLILKYDWNFENSLWGPMQVYYHYQRIVATN